MINLNTEYPEKEDIEEARDRIFARLREDINDLELLFKRIIDGRSYLSKDEVAMMLRCTEDELPKALPKYQAGRNYIYKVADVVEFIESRRLGGKK